MNGKSALAIEPFEHLRRGAEQHPDKLALRSPDVGMTYRELFVYASRVARELRTVGVQPGNIVALNLGDVDDCVFTWAVFHEAAIAVPFGPEVAAHPSINIDFVITRNHVDDVPDENQIVIDDAWMKRVVDHGEWFESRRYGSASALCSMYLTSGTTGRPKIIAQTIDLLNRCSENVPPSPFRDTAHLYPGPSRSGPGWFYRFSAFTRGDTYYLVDPVVEKTVGMIVSESIAGLTCSPTQLTTILDGLEAAGVNDLPVTHVMTIGAPFPTVLVERLRTASPHANIFASYASTEASLTAFRNAEVGEPNDIGELVAGVTLEIVDDEGNPVNDGTVGMVRVKSDTMIHEYLGEPELSARVFQNGWFYPGDMAVRRDGRILLAGRFTEIINRGGIKVDPNAIDDAALHIPDVAACASFGYFDDEDAEKIGCVYVAPREISHAEMIDALRPLVLHAIPDLWERVSEIPLGPTGKPLRRELSDRYSK